MKREIKFRAKSLDGELIYFELHESNISGDSEVFYVNDIPCESGTEQEYTGLKDKNGKEIYEGDIIKIGHYEDDDCILHEVEYCGYRDYPAFELKPDTGADSNGLSWAIADAAIFEIIGNIYENPELLKS